MTLEILAGYVKSNFKKLTESEIVGRIMLLSGRNLERSLKGYEMMKKEKLIEKLVDQKTDGKFIAMLEKYPNLHTLIDSLECVPGKTEITPGAKPEKVKPQPVFDSKTFISLLNLPDW